MNIAQTISLAATSGISAGWGIGMAFCMLMMGVMMFGMMRHSRDKGGESRWSFGDWRGSPSETPIEILERRFAEGEISAEDYRERRETLTNGGPRAGAVRESEREAAAKATREEEP